MDFAGPTKYGGSRPARQAAIAWRDEQLTKTKVLGVLEFCQKMRSNNRSSVPGVHFLTPPVQPEGIWQAKLKLADGTCTTKTFSVRKHGERKAFGLAVAARREMIERARIAPTCMTRWPCVLPSRKRLRGHARSCPRTTAKR